LTFAPGLLDILKSTTPPTIAFFKSLPSSYDKVWAVYLLVLEKRGARPRIYVGSATEMQRGVRSRFKNYDTGHTIPMYVASSFREGYKITHKGLLCTMPIPPNRLASVMEVLFLGMEATFAFVFWAMHADGKDYGVGYQACLWPVKDLEYTGLCHHSSAREGGVRQHGLSEDEIEIIALKLNEIRKQKQSANLKNWYMRTKALDPVAYNLKRLQNSRNRDQAKVKVNNKKAYEKGRDTGKWSCKPCKQTFASAQSRDKHLRNPKFAHLHPVEPPSS
jgi:hypothetical protein